MQWGRQSPGCPEASGHYLENRAVFNPDRSTKQDQCRTMLLPYVSRRQLRRTSKVFQQPGCATRGFLPSGSDSTRSPLRFLSQLASFVWLVLTLPFRILILTISLLGRLTGAILGFSLMIVGMALCTGSLFIVGIPVFIVGLLLLFRSLA